MLKLNSHPIRREVPVAWTNLTHGRPLCLSLDETGITCWAKGTRYRKRLSWAMIAELAALKGDDA